MTYYAVKHIHFPCNVMRVRDQPNRGDGVAGDEANTWMNGAEYIGTRVLQKDCCLGALVCGVGICGWY